ncbi:MAG: GNAT family N-acetyltransferase [Lysobacter sp.]|nr:GNAT family N-acetyltransferase [Lysobacter sp.]
MSAAIPSPSLVHSDLDSRRFGIDIARARLDAMTPKALATEVLSSGIDVAIVRLPAGQSSGINELRNWALPVLHADTLVYYKCDLTRHEPTALRNIDLDFSIASHSDMGELESLILSTFENYVSHYHANPLFPPGSILAGYLEWALGHLQGSGRTLWVARRGGRIAAFAACHRIDMDTAEGILYGVRPEEAGGGLYGDLIRHTQAVAKAEGAKTMIVSTQVDNFAVQKVWAREGFHLFEAWNTYHISALMSCGEMIKHKELRFTAEEIRRFAEATGDMNPLHLDALAAAASGLPAPIAHGVMTLGEMSRVLGMETPGHGTVILHMDVAYLRPVIADRTYTMNMREVRADHSTRPFKVITTVRDAENSVCIVARADVVVKR